MADKKISALPSATTPLAGTEVLPIVQGGVTDQVSVANLTSGRDVAVKKLNPTDNVVMVAGKGIDFSANANAPGMTSEVLTWYEEGTWTPATFTNWSTAPTSILAAKYTRIGRLVTLNVLGYEGVITGSGIIAGLPFAVDTSGGSLTIQDVAGAGVTSFGIVEGGSSRISGLTAANYTGKYWHFSCSYVV